MDRLLTMSSQEVFSLLGVLAFLALVLNVIAARLDFKANYDGLAVSGLLALILQVSIVVNDNPTPPSGVGSLIYLLLVDTVGVVMVARLFPHKPALWKGLVAFCFLAMIVAHVAFWRAFLHGQETLIGHTITLNVLCVVQFVAAVYKGVRGVAVVAVDHLPRHRALGVQPLHRGSP